MQCSQHIQIQIYLIQVSRNGFCVSVKQVQIEIFTLIINYVLKSLTNNHIQEHAHTHTYARQPFFQLFYLQ